MNTVGLEGAVDRNNVRMLEFCSGARFTTKAFEIGGVDVSAAGQHLDSKKKVLRLGYMPSIGPNRLAPLITRFGAEQPGVELVLVEASHSSLSDLLLNSRLDAMLAAYVDRPDKRLRYCRLYEAQC